MNQVKIMRGRKYARDIQKVTGFAGGFHHIMGFDVVEFDEFLMRRSDYDHDESTEENVIRVFGNDVARLVNDCLNMEKASVIADELIAEARKRSRGGA